MQYFGDADLLLSMICVNFASLKLIALALRPIYNIMEYKKVYSSKDIDDLKAWFDVNRERLPKSIRFDKATLCDNVEALVQNTLAALKTQAKNPVFGMQINYLFKLRDAVESGNFETE